mgnify:CR=1 FL=1|jgi:hypothetical protein
MGGEELLIQQLQARGAIVAVCCDFGQVSLAQQLGYAIHADVILGQHGAGLANIVFAAPGSMVVELKTLYGYQLDLFRVLTDAVSGVHVHIDVGTDIGAVKIDEALASRVVGAMEITSTSQANAKATATAPKNHNSTRDKPADAYALVHSGKDCVQNMASVSHGFGPHILGPRIGELASLCRQSDFNEYWGRVKADKSKYCTGCGK